MRSLINTSLASLAIAGLLGTTQAVAQEISTPETTTPFASEQVLTWDEDGNPTSGVISFDVETAIIKPRTTENVGGGTWTYDVTHDSTGAKICSSKYMHKTKTHTATASWGVGPKPSAPNQGTGQTPLSQVEFLPGDVTHTGRRNNP